jgi:hypothetical protein
VPALCGDSVRGCFTSIEWEHTHSEFSWLQEYNDEYDETQSPTEIKEESDDDQDTDMFDDSCDNQDSSSHVEHTDIIEISQDELHNLDSYLQEEYVIVDSADAQLEDEAVADHMQEESADVKSEHSENDSSQSVVREIKHYRSSQNHFFLPPLLRR